MNAPADIRPLATLSDTRKAALLNLLGDDDPAVYQVIRQQILSNGPGVVSWLRPHKLSSDPVLRRRAKEIIEYLARQAADDRFTAFCLVEGNDLSLEDGAWLLAQTQYPDINVSAYQALFDNYAAELLERIDLRAEPEPLITAFNDYFFQTLNFKGNEESYYDPENSYLNRVLDRRTGNPINLCLAYLLLARRLRLPMTGIGLPGHFVCRYQTLAAEVYIDVFNGGKIWTKANCIQYLQYRNFPLQEEYLSPVSSRRMLSRICTNLHQIYQHLALAEETTRLQRYLVALAK